MKEVKSNLEEIGIFYEIRNAGDYKKVVITNEKNKKTGQTIGVDPKKRVNDDLGLELGSPIKINFDKEPIDLDKLLKVVK